MKKLKELPSEKATPDTKSIETRIMEKRAKLEEIHTSLAVYMLQDMTFEKKAKVAELQDRLFFRTQNAEEALLNDKIDLYSQALSVLKK